MTVRAGAALAGLILLPGCMLAERPVPPDAAVTAPAQWRSTPAATAPIAAEWWQAYGDPVLATLVERALARNTDIAIAAARVRQAEAAVAQARSQLFPALDAAAAAGHSRSLSAFGTASVGSSFEPQVQASWEVDLFGRLRDLVGAARDQYLASAAAHDAAALSVAAATASSYITLRALDTQLRVAHDTLAARTESLRLARANAEAGYTSQLELSQAQAEYEATARIVPQVERAIAAQENALSRLAGDTPGAIERGRALADLIVPPVPEGLPSDLLRRRPDIAQAEYQLAASDRSLAAARKAFLPNIQLTGSAGVLFATGIDPVGLFSVGGSVLAPLFDAGRARAGADSAAAVRDQAAYAYRGVALSAFAEVESALVALDRLGRERDHVRAQRDALAAALRHATNRYRAGYSTYLEQLDAQRGLLAAELALVQIDADRLNASVTLYRAMGGGWTGLAGAG